MWKVLKSKVWVLRYSQKYLIYTQAEKDEEQKVHDSTNI